MKIKRVGFEYKREIFQLDARVCNWFEKFLGLMFCRREKAEALLFEFGNMTEIKIHSLFVFFPFVAVWLDDKNKIIDLKIVKPFTFSVSSSGHFTKLLEIPINKKFEEICNLLISRR